jgi:hypothetical protein
MSHSPSDRFDRVLIAEDAKLLMNFVNANKVKDKLESVSSKSAVRSPRRSPDFQELMDTSSAPFPVPSSPFSSPLHASLGSELQTSPKAPLSPKKALDTLAVVKATPMSPRKLFSASKRSREMLRHVSSPTTESRGRKIPHPQFSDEEK